MWGAHLHAWCEYLLSGVYLLMIKPPHWATIANTNITLTGKDVGQHCWTRSTRWLQLGFRNPAGPVKIEMYPHFASETFQMTNRNRKSVCFQKLSPLLLTSLHMLSARGGYVFQQARGLRSPQWLLLIECYAGRRGGSARLTRGWRIEKHGSDRRWRGNKVREPVCACPRHR